MLENSDRFLYLTSVLSCDDVLIVGHWSVRTDAHCINACFDYHFPDFAAISWLVHAVLVFSSKHADRSRSQLRNCREWIHSKQLTYWWEHTANARGQFNKSPTQNLWTFLANWLFFTVFVSWGGFDYIMSQFDPSEIFERKLDEQLAARKPWWRTFLQHNLGYFLERSRNCQLLFFSENSCKIPIIFRSLTSFKRSVSSSKILDPYFILFTLFDGCLTQHLQCKWIV